MNNSYSKLQINLNAMHRRITQERKKLANGVEIDLHNLIGQVTKVCELVKAISKGAMLSDIERDAVALDLSTIITNLDELGKETSHRRTELDKTKKTDEAETN